MGQSPHLYYLSLLLCSVKFNPCFGFFLRVFTCHVARQLHNFVVNQLNARVYVIQKGINHLMLVAKEFIYSTQKIIVLDKLSS